MKKRLEIGSGDDFWIERFTCDICDQFAVVLGIDNSCKEYNPNYICLECIQEGFKKFGEEES